MLTWNVPFQQDSTNLHTGECYTSCLPVWQTSPDWACRRPLAPGPHSPWWLRWARLTSRLHSPGLEEVAPATGGTALVLQGAPLPQDMVWTGGAGIFLQIPPNWIFPGERGHQCIARLGPIYSRSLPDKQGISSFLFYIVKIDKYCHSTLILALKGANFLSTWSGLLRLESVYPEWHSWYCHPTPHYTSGILRFLLLFPPGNHPTVSHGGSLIRELLEDKEYSLLNSVVLGYFRVPKNWTRGQKY